MSTLFTNVTAVLVDEQNTVLKNAYVAVDGTNITHVGLDRPEGEFTEIIDGHGGILMPGLVNAHTHLPMTMMRGYGDGHDLQDWLFNYIFPVEDKWDGRSIRSASALGLAEMIASGTTAVEDMYMFLDEIAEEVAASGMSANITLGCNLFPDEKFDAATHSGCVRTRAYVDRWHGYNGGQIKVDASIHAEYTTRPELWEYLAGYAKEKDLGMHVHVSETRKEHNECVERYGMTPTQVLSKYGVFDVRAIAAHCVWTTPDDWAILAEKGVTAAHNPCSNLKLGSGVAPIIGMRKAGVNIALGTDGVSSNNTTDMFEDLKIAAMLQNGVNHDPLALLPIDALRMATVNGAKALGRNSGRIAVGCTADLVLLDPTAPNLIPCHDPISNIAYAAHGSNVCVNMCRGKVIYRNGEFLTIDIERVRREVEQYALPHLFG